MLNMNTRRSAMVSSCWWRSRAGSGGGWSEWMVYLMVIFILCGVHIWGVVDVGGSRGVGGCGIGIAVFERWSFRVLVITVQLLRPLYVGVSRFFRGRGVATLWAGCGCGCFRVRG